MTRVGKKVERIFELKEGKGVDHWVVSLAVKDVSWVVQKALTRVGKKVEKMVELKEENGIEDWAVTIIAKKNVSWVV